ncbi:MAG: hypothetical protein E7573_01710 [Ruminococcaceae bacterium]|nr:hypothetical protein [Oscillospiraceae bacterium]
MSEFTQSIFKGKTEDEISTDFNKKWIEIINNCAYKISKETPKRSLQQSDKHGIISLTENQTCSANLEKRGAE